MFIPVVNTSAERLVINTDQIAIVFNNQVTMSNAFSVELTTDSMKEVEEALFPKKRSKNNQPKDGMLELFEKLHKLTGGKGKAILTLQREKKLNDLLTKHRLSEENLITAATNIGKDAFLQGENDSNKRYGDIDYLLRPDKAAKWAEEQEKKKKGMF